jgi:hypothetical protein
MDNELSVRAGLNIGIEPTLLPFVQAAAGNIIPIAPSGDTVIAEHTDQAARVLFSAGGGGGDGSGWVWNTALDTVDINFYFVDDLGNEILLGGGAISGVPGPVELELENFEPAPDESGAFFCLAPKEKIVARLSPTPPPPPA